MQSSEIRQRFLDYFARNGHTILPSSSLIPHGDKTILFTNAGMNQFKNAFLGLEKRAYTRAATSQKVMRISGKHNDLENVGPSRRHHTFFEMLGNFSFGDYFKADAMRFALELMEGEYGFKRERMWFTIFRDDDESEALWQKVGIKRERILRFGEKDNFWSMGPTGPCGPNSEIHYFTGKLEDNDARWVNNDDDPNETTVEVWNLVFMQFNRDESGVLHPLPQTGVDTGMGFERLVRLIVGGESNYDTDLFLPLMARTQALARQSDAERQANKVAYRVIADHARAAAFLIGDGVLPGNEGRNYALRMIMRRAMRFGRTIGLEEPFLNQVCDAVIDHMSPAYPELANGRDRILRTVLQEEEKFERTLDQGLELLERSFHSLGANKTLPGETAFKLYDTYGLPVEITRDIARERSIAVDEDGFQAAREAAREVARAASKDKFVANYDQARARDLGAIAQTLGVGQDRAAEQAARLAQELGDTRKALERAQVALARARFDQVLAQETPLGGQSVLIARVETATSDTLREMTDWYRAARPEGVCVLGAVIGDKPQAVVSVPAALNKRGLDAGKVIRDIAGVMGGGGGGRPTFAQGSGKDAAKLDDALARARALVEAALKA